MKRILVLTLSALLIATMMPAGAFAATWGGGDTDAERESSVIIDYEGNYDESAHKYPDKINTINYKSGTLKPFTIRNIDAEIGNTDQEIDDAMKADIAGYEITDWINIAEKIFKSKAKDDSSIRGTSYVGINHDFGYYFESGNDRSHGQIDMVKWLNKKTSDDDVYTRLPLTKWWWGSSGFKKASSLKDLRNKTAEFCSNVYKKHAAGKKMSRDGILGRRSAGVLDSLNNADQSDVYYTLFAHNVMQLAEGDNTQYNVYGVALYDFEVSPLGGDGLNFPGQEENITGVQTGDKEKDFWVEHNQTTPGRETATLTIGSDETHTVGKTQTSGWSWGVQAGAKFTVSVGKDTWPVKGSGEFSFGGNFNKMQENALNEQYSETNTGSYSNELSFDLDAHTATKVSQKHTKTTGYVKYNAPVIVTYKAAIFSLSGTYQDMINTWGYEADLCTLFDGSSSGSWDAVSSLYERTQNQSLGGDPGGRTYGYFNEKLVTSEVNWTSSALSTDKIKVSHLGSDGKKTTAEADMKTVITNRSRWMPMLGVGSRFNFVEDGYTQSSGKSIPLFPLKEIRVNGDIEREYDMVLGESMSLDHFDVMGYDNDENYGSVKYSGFDPSSGGWKVATHDRSGNALPDGIISLEKDPNSGAVRVHADRVPEKGETAYITWELSDSAKYVSKGDITVSKTQNPPEYPYIKINVHPDIEGKTVAFRGGSSAEAGVCAGENLDLFNALPADVYDADGFVISHDVVYALQDQTGSDASISADGIFTASKEGTYRIKARYGAGGSYITSSDTATVTVTAARSLKIEPAGVSIVRGSESTLAEYDIRSLISLKDQYGERWAGEMPELVYELVDKDGNPITISGASVHADTGILKMLENGVWYVKVSAKDDPSAFGIASVTVKHNEDKPAAKAENTMKVKAKTVKVKYSRLKKKSRKVKAEKAFTVKTPKGKVTYAKVSGSKKIKVAKNGTLTVAKGTGKGTHKVKVKVKAAGNAEYKAGTKTVTVSIRVK